MIQSCWHVHWSGLGEMLSPWATDIQEGVARAERSLAEKSAVPALDILVGAREESAVIPQLGMGAWAMSPSLVVLACAPKMPAFEKALTDGAVAQLMVHEANHCLRWSAGRQPRSLAEALVSEGLAGRFVAHILGTPPAPWEQPVSAAEFDRWWPGPAALHEEPYDHAAWFCGTGTYPHWIGYRLGFEVVGRWLANKGTSVQPHERYATPAAEILEDLGLA